MQCSMFLDNCKLHPLWVFFSVAGAPWHRNRGTESLYLGCCTLDGIGQLPIPRRSHEALQCNIKRNLWGLIMTAAWLQKEPIFKGSCDDSDVNSIYIYIYGIILLVVIVVWSCLAVFSKAIPSSWLLEATSALCCAHPPLGNWWGASEVVHSKNCWSAQKTFLHGLPLVSKSILETENNEI